MLVRKGKKPYDHCAFTRSDCKAEFGERLAVNLVKGMLFIPRADTDWILWAFWYVPKHRGKVWSRWV